MKASETVKNIVKKKKKACIITGILVIAVAGGVYFFRIKAKDKQETSVTIESATAEKGNISTSVTGTGNLETAETVDVTVPSGIEIDEVKVESGDTVKKGQTLATVKKASVASALSEVEDSMETVAEELEDSSLTDLEIEELNATYTELKSLKETLTTLHETLTITATSDGVIGSVNVSAGSEVSASSSGSSNTSSNSTSGTSSGSSSSGSSSVTKTSSASATSSSENSTSNLSYTKGNSSGITLLTTTTKTVNTGDSTADTEDTDNNAETTSAETVSDEAEVATLSAETISTVTDYSNLVIPSPVTGEKGISKIDAEKTKSQGYEVTSITWDCNGKFQAGTAYTTTIELKALDGYQFTSGNTPVLDCSAYKCEVSGDGEGNRMTITAKYEKTAADAKSEDNKSSGNTASGTGNEGTSNNTAETSDNGNGGTSANSSASNAGADASGGTGDSAGTSGGTGTSDSTGTSGSTESSGSSTASDLYSSSNATAFTILTEDSYKISLSVDELDILSVKQGQTVNITLDALDGESFEGTVTKVGTVGSTSGSSAKYTVEITVPKAENMLLGMSASATIQIDEADDAVLIPLSALQESGGKSFVYTEKSEDGTLSGKVEVETGLSNDSQVEITSGLSEGDTVYYQVVEKSSDDQGMNMDFGGEMPGGGEAPSDGGNAPGGGGEAPSGNGGGPSGGGQKSEN